MIRVNFTIRHLSPFPVLVMGALAIASSVLAQNEKSSISTSTEGASTVERQLIDKQLPNDAHKTHTLTLTDCYAIGKERNIAIKQAQNNITSSIIDRKMAQNSLLPSMSYNLGHYFSFGKNIDPVTNAFVTEQFSGGYTTLSMELELFTGFKKLNTIKQSAYLIQSAEFAKKNAELELLSNITLSYARLLLDKEQLITERSNIENTSKELATVNEKIRVGRLSKYEFYIFNARLNTEQADLVTIQNDSLAASQTLKQQLNLSYKQPLDIASIDTAVLSHILTTRIVEQEFIGEILNNHPAIKQAEMNEKASRIGEKVARSGFLPSLSVGGNVVSNYNIGEEDDSGGKIPLRKQLDNNLGQNINISLSVPIFSQLENANRVKKEKINTFNAQLAIDDAKNTVVTNTLQLIDQFNGAKQKFSAILSAWEQNKLSYELFEEKYKLGQMSSVELLTGRDILNASTSKYLQAKLQLFFQYQLLQLLKAH